MTSKIKIINGFPPSTVKILINKFIPYEHFSSNQFPSYIINLLKNIRIGKTTDTFFFY